MKQRLLAAFLLPVILISGCTAKTQESAKPEPAPNPASIDPARLSQAEYAEMLNELLPLNNRRILEQADELELMSVKPEVLWDKSRANTVAAGGHMRFAIIGKTAITDPDLRKKLIKALYDGLAASQGSMACYSPRHAIRAKSKGKAVELVICFECGNFYGNGPDGELGGRISNSPEELFNRVLTSAGVPLG